MKTLLVAYAAGGLGALAACLTMWLFGRYGIPQSFDVALAPSWSPAWLYPRIVWGGLWGLLFALPMLQGRPLLKGSLLSLFPALVLLLIVFPLRQGHGVAGIELGWLAPFFVLFYCWVWGIVTALTIRFAR